MARASDGISVPTPLFASLPSVQFFFAFFCQVRVVLPFAGKQGSRRHIGARASDGISVPTPLFASLPSVQLLFVFFCRVRVVLPIAGKQGSRRHIGARASDGISVPTPLFASLPSVQLLFAFFCQPSQPSVIPKGNGNSSIIVWEKRSNRAKFLPSVLAEEKLSGLRGEQDPST
jgi:cadmium resistance protein CadD (predicted permease)